MKAQQILSKQSYLISTLPNYWVYLSTFGQNACEDHSITLITILQHISEHNLLYLMLLVLQIVYSKATV